MSANNPPKDVKLTDSIAEDFLKDDFKVSPEVPALYDKMMAERSGRSSYRGKLTPERYEAIIRYIRNGAAFVHAANAVGIDDNTLYRWIKKGTEDPESIFGLFVEDLKRAKAAAINRNVLIVQRAAEDDWTAAKWLLTILDPTIFGNKTIVKNEISGPEGKPIEHKVVYISDDELRKLAAVQDIIEETNKVIDADYTVVEDEESEEDTPEE
jgi:transposase-like protein